VLAAEVTRCARLVVGEAVAVAAWVSATPAAFDRVSVVVVLAVQVNVPLFAALVNPAAVKTTPTRALDPPPVIVPV